MVELPKFLFRRAPRWAFPVGFVVVAGIVLLIAYLMDIFPKDKKKSEQTRDTETPSPVDTPDTTTPAPPTQPEQPGDETEEETKDAAEDRKAPEYYFIGATALFSVINFVIIAVYYGIYKADRARYPVQESIGFGIWGATLLTFFVALAIDLADEPGGREFALFLYRVTFGFLTANVLWCSYWFTQGFQQKKETLDSAFDLYEKYDTEENRELARQQIKNVQDGIESLQNFYDAYQKGLLQTTYDYTLDQASAISTQVTAALRSGSPTVIVDTMSKALSQASNVTNTTKDLLKEAVVQNEATNAVKTLGPENMKNYVDPSKLSTPQAKFQGGLTTEVKDELDNIYSNLSGFFSGPDIQEFEKKAKEYLELNQKVLYPESNEEKDTRHAEIIKTYKKGKGI